MKRCPPLRFRAATIAAILIALFAVSAFAQLQTGNIFGTTQAKDGSVLPGVTVVLTGVAAPETFITDAQGKFRFLNLSPGSYTVKAELAGYGSATRSGVSVNVGRNADLTMTLNPSVSESITVTAEAPLLDVRRTGTGATVTKVELEKIPTGRDPWVILQQTPGVLMDRINVGGNESGQQSSYVGKGTTSDQSTWNVDGVNITDVGALGSSPTYYDFDSFEEMQVTTGGTDVRIQTPGVQLNMVTKRGTNDLKGSARYYQTNGNLQSDPKIPSEAQSYLYKVNEIDNIDDYGIEAGGPIMKDRLWLWGAYSKQNVNLFVAQPNTAAIIALGRFADKTKLETYNAKLNAQIVASNSLSLAGMIGNKDKLGRNIGPTRLPETAWNQGSSYTGPTMWKAEDTHIFSPNFYLTGLYSKVQGGFQLIADNGKGCQTYACGVTAPVAVWDLAGDGAWHKSYASYITTRPQTQYRGDASTFFNTGSLSHELKFGLGYRDAKVNSTSGWPADQNVIYGNGGAANRPGVTGASAGVTFQRPTGFDYQVKTTDAYVGDTVLLGNLTLQAGLRYDLQKGSVQAGSTTANSVIPDILPAISWGGITGLKWDSISPRLGLTYTLGSTRKTLLRAAANRYVDQLGGATVYLTAPGAYQYLYYYFTDLNGDQRAQRNEIDFDTGIAAFGGLDPHKSTSAISLYRWDKNLKAPHTDEIILGAEHELMSDLSFGVNATYRRLSDQVVNRAEHHQGQGDLFSPADYQLHAPATCAPPTNCGTFGSYSVPYYTLKPGVAAPLYYVIMNQPDYSQTYKGLDLMMTKRMSNRWMMRGSISLNDWTQNVGPGAISDPSRLRNAFGCNTCDGGAVVQGSGTGSGAKGGVYINSKWAYNLTGVYQIPVIETSLGFNLTGRQGYPVPYIHRVSVGGTAADPLVPEGFKFLLLGNDSDTYRLHNLTNLDLRLAKDIRVFRSAGITISVDAFNILNANTILQRNTRLGTATGNRITEIQSPRVFRAGARITF
jgi:hypothetical protein